MLSKKVCMYCTNHADRQNYRPWFAGEKEHRYDETWEHTRKVCCFPRPISPMEKAGWYFAKIDEPPPKDCPYFLEHMIEQGA